MAQAAILSKVFGRKNLIANLQARDKESAIAEMVGRLATNGQIKADQANAVVKAIMKREELGSTGIGRGIAVPHARHAAVGAAAGVLGISRSGIGFQALDGLPVYALFLVLSPPDASDEHIQVLRRITALTRDEDLRMFLRQCANEQAIAELLAEADEKLSRPQA